MKGDVRLRVVFYRNETGDEPVRDWLKSLPPEERKTIGGDIKTVQFGWPLGMPLVRKLESNLWEIRSSLEIGISQEEERKVKGVLMNEEHIGSSFDDFLAEEGILGEVEAVAIKRVVAFQIAELMKENNLSKSQMARRMNTSRASLDRLLDPANSSVTLQTLEAAARALGKRLHIQFVS